MNDIGRSGDVGQAERDGAGHTELSLQLGEAGDSGEMARQLKPVLIGVAVLAGAAALVGVAVLATRRNRPARWLPPQRASRLSGLARTAGLALVRLAAQHAARALLQHVSVAVALEPEPPLTAQ